MGKIYMVFGYLDYVKLYWESYQYEIQLLICNIIIELFVMFDELVYICESGVVMDREENELGVFCIVVLVFDIYGWVLYVVLILFLILCLKQVGEKNFLKLLCEIVQVIFNELGFIVRDDLGVII